ncbi:MAG: hypothetical protein Kow00109_30180 [Acidobacteriota bacterium]
MSILERTHSFPALRWGNAALALILAACLLDVGQAQGVRHILYGDLKVEGADEAPVALARTFQVLLREGTSNRLIGRDTVTAGGRYRFNGVSNGEYVLEIVWDNRVVYQDRFIINEFKKDDIRKDIELRFNFPAATDKGGGIVYARSSRAERWFRDALERKDAGDLSEAARLLQRIVDEDGEDFEAWTELGTVHFLAGKRTESERCYVRALELRPDYFPARLNLGKLLLAEKRYQQALDELLAATERRPDYAEAHYLVGEAYLGLKLGSRAVPAMEKALELDPDGMAEAHLRLAVLYDAAGYRDRAAAEYRKFLAKRPDFEQRAQLEDYIRRYGAGRR